MQVLPWSWRNFCVCSPATSDRRERAAAAITGNPKCDSRRREIHRPGTVSKCRFCRGPGETSASVRPRHQIGGREPRRRLPGTQSVIHDGAKFIDQDRFRNAGFAVVLEKLLRLFARDIRSEGESRGGDYREPKV